MFRVQLLALVVVLVSIAHAQSQLIFGKHTYCVATATLVKGEPVFTAVKFSPKDGRVERRSLIATRQVLGDEEELVHHYYATMRYPLPLRVESEKNDLATQPRRYLIQSLDGKQIKKETFVQSLRARKGRKMHVLLLEPERVLSPVEKELLNPKTTVIRTFDYAFSWYHGDKLRELPLDYVRNTRTNKKTDVLK